MQSKVWSQFSAYDMSQWVHEGVQFCPVIWTMFNLTRRTYISPYTWNIITVLENASGESESCRQRRTSGTKTMVAWCLYRNMYLNLTIKILFFFYFCSCVCPGNGQRMASCGCSKCPALQPLDWMLSISRCVQLCFNHILHWYFIGSMLQYFMLLVN